MVKNHQTTKPFSLHAKDIRLEFAMVQVLWNELAGQQFAGIFPEVSHTFSS